MRKTHSIELQVRDYECDAQGIVNNAVYLHYLEYARHSFLQDRGISFQDLIARGIFLVVVRAEIDYSKPLRGGDMMRVETGVEKMSRLKFNFHQRILSLPAEEAVLKARITGTSLDKKGRPRFFPDIDELLT